MSKHWYNNDIISRVYDEGTQPSGWKPGRLSGCGKSTLGKHWYNNGIIQGNFIEGTQPDGWILGTLGNSTKNYKTYNNGIEARVFPPDSPIPEGWVLGRLKSTNNRYKAAAQSRKVTWYNNGLEEIKLVGNAIPPEGYSAGRLKKLTNREERDLYYKSIGYIPLKELSNKYGKSWYINLPDIKKVVFKDPYVYVHESELPRIEAYIKENHSKGTSHLEKDLADYVKSIYSGNIITNTKAILKDDSGKYYELDIYIPDKKVAIEFNGMFWHSTSNISDKNYHLIKTELASKLGIRLLHVFQDQWECKNAICKSIIKHSLGIADVRIYARDCAVKDVPKSIEKEFLLNNHIQGYVSSSKCIGLYYNNELVQLISFGKSRYKNGELELLRQCSKLDYSVIGGFSKLLAHSGIDSCVSYIDRALFTGDAYFNVGFSLLGSTPPSYFYVNSRDILTRYNRLHFQKHKLSCLLDNFDPNKTEVANMIDNGYLQIYDCGTLKVYFVRR